MPGSIIIQMILHNPSKTRILAQIGMLGAISVVLMLFEIPLPFAPAFYEIDFSEVPVLVGCFAMGPVAGAAIELIKILLNFAINGTITNKFIKHPLEAVSVGDVVDVKVLSVDLKKKRIALTMKNV